MMTTKVSPTPTSSSNRAQQKLRAFHEEEAPKQSPNLALMSRLWPFMKPNRKWLFLSLGALLLVTGFNLVRPLIMKQIVHFAEKKQANSVLNYGIILVVLGFVTQGFSFIQLYSMQLVGAKSMASLRTHLFSFLQKLRLGFLDKTPLGRLVTRVTNDVDALGEIFASGVFSALGDVLLLVGIIVAMLLLDWRLALISFLAIPLILTLVLWARSRTKAAYRDIRTKTARLNAFLNEQVGGIAVVQAYGQEKSMQSEFDEINQSYRDANKRSIFYEALLDAAIEMVSTLCIAGILWWLGFKNLVQYGITFDLLVAFTQYIKLFLEPISLLAQRYTILQSALTGAERIFQLLDEKEIETEMEKVDQTSEKPFDPSQQESTLLESNVAVEFDHIQFSYKPGVPVLQDMTFSIKKGEKVALVGATGSGKTTITSLLLRMYETQAGHIRVFGKEIHDYSFEGLRRLFAVIPQDVILFPGTLLSNITLSDPNPDVERVKQIINSMGVTRFVQELGLDSKIEERGSNVSVGERQILAFARAMYRNAPIFILDEATASIDSDTESKLQKALDVALQERTALIIAHRLSTIQSADRILVLHKGQLVEQGTHAELLAKEGVYSRLYQLQFSLSQTG